MANKKPIILFAGGGSGGHVYPILAVAEELSNIKTSQGIEADFRYMGPKDKWSAILEEAGMRIHPIVAGKIRRYFSIKNIIDIPKFMFGVFEAWFKMFFVMPDVVFSKGGPGALPVVWAAWFYRVPVIIHESDAVPGLTTLLSAPFASNIALGFEEVAKYFNPKKTLITGNPLRHELIAMKQNMTREEAKSAMGLNPAEPLLLVLGGSQGAQKINELIILGFEDILSKTQIVHQTGQENFSQIKNLSRAAMLDISVQIEKKHQYRPTAFMGTAEYSKALIASDIVLTRAGAGTLAEITAIGRASIVVPLSGSAQDHQKANAYALADKGVSVVIEEKNLNPDIFMHEFERIMSTAGRKGALEEAALTASHPDAAKQIANKIDGIIN